MSAEHVGWAFRQKDLSPTRKFVLVALADRCNKDTLRCDPTLRRLQEDTGLSESAIKQSIRDLCDRGLLIKIRRKRDDGSDRSNAYRFPALGVAPTREGASETPGEGASGAGKPEVVLEPEETPLRLAPQASIPPLPAVTAREAAERLQQVVRSSPRRRNEVWDALGEIFGEPTTRSAQKVRGKVCSSLTAARASPDEIFARAKRWRLHFDGATMTDLALEKHWDTLERKPLR